MHRSGLRFASFALVAVLATAARDGVGTDGLSGEALGILAFERPVGGLSCAAQSMDHSART